MATPMTDLGIGQDLIDQVKGESEDERKKRKQAAAVSRLTGNDPMMGGGLGTVASLFGGGIGGGYGT